MRLYSEKSKSEKARLAYLTGNYYGITHTFIHDEVRELRRLGMKINIFSVHRPKKNMASKNYSIDSENAFFVFPLNIFRFISAHTYYLGTKPVRYGKILLFLFTRERMSPRNMMKTFYHFAEGIYLGRKAEKDSVRHIHVHFSGGPVTSAMVIHMLTGISYSFSAHGTPLLLRNVLLKQKVAYAKFVITVSEFNREYILKDMPQYGGKIHVVRCGIDTDAFQPPLKEVNKRQPSIISVGSLVWEKAHHVLIEACRILKENGYAFSCTIVGEGPERKRLEGLIQKYQLQSWVELKGAMPHDSIKEILDQADIFVLASVVEGIPVALMEAMAKKVPVIASNITGIPELVEDHLSGFLVPPRNPKKLANAIYHLMNDYELRARFGEGGRHVVLERFDIRKNVKKLERLFGQVL